jgi:hypothetical protein
VNISAAVDLLGELVGVLAEEFPQGCVVVERVGPRELEPCAAAAVEPVSTDVLGLLGFDRAWRKPGFAL